MSKTLLNQARRTVRQAHAAKLELRRNFSAVAGSRAEMHAMALQMNQEHQIKKAQKFDTEEDVVGAPFPAFLKFHYADSVADREYKRRQQTFYYIEEKYGYVDDILIKKGAMTAEEVASKRAAMKRSIESRKHLTDQLADPKVSLAQLQQLEAQFGVPEEMRIADSDSRKEQQKKIKDQVQFYIDTSKEALEMIPTTKEQNEASIAEYVAANRQDADTAELQLMENADEISEYAINDPKELEAKMEELRVRATEATKKLELDHFTKTKALQNLGLIRRGTLTKLEGELRKAVNLAGKRSAEFELRFGRLPDMDEDPYMAEYDDQMKFLDQRRADRTLASSEAAINAPEAEESTSDSDDAVAADPAAEENEAEMEAHMDGAAESGEEIIAVSTPKVNKAASQGQDLDAYAAQRTPRTFISSEQEDGEQWPKIVDGLQLDHYEHLREVDYEAFEDPPEDFEVRIMDAFALQRQMRQSKAADQTLVPRVHVPNHPKDESLIAKALLLYRMHAIRRFVHELKEERVREYERAYRDLRDLKLDLAYDPVNPWKNDIYDEVQLVLKNQQTWTQGNKERFVHKMHAILSSDVFSEENQNQVKF